MYSLETLANFLGWCSLLNIGLLLFSTLLLSLAMRPLANIHSKLFGIDKSSLPMAYFRYLANYKLLMLVFNLVPYIALRIVL